ncbi:hypothetical protein LJR164_001635 [Phenylobacterium sp. LjRoot164]|uniref:hypothetical protein n=1 Tax=unclassified Phenylobacterium TaxID=2640670 RepID=UPI003ECD376F
MVELYVPRVADAINAFEAGREGAMTRRKDQAAQMIGGAMSRGDYRGAAEAAYGVGDYGVGLKLEQLGTDRATQDRMQGYGRQYAEGKGGDAVKAAYAAGDFEIGKELAAAIAAASEADRAFMKEKAERIAAIVAPLGDIPESDMDRRRAFIAEHTPELLAAGYTQDQLASFEPTNANLAPIYSQALGLKDYLGNQRDDKKFAADEDYRKQQLRISQGQLGVAQGNLALSQQRENRVAAGGGASGGGGWEEF